MVRILVLCEFASLNGAERSLLSVLPDLGQMGLDLLVAAPEAGALGASLDELGIARTAFELRDRQGERLPAGESQTQLRMLIRHASVNVVHANSLAMSRLSGPVAKAAGIAGIGHLRDIIRVSRRAIDRLNQQTRLLAVSAATRDWYVKLGLEPARTYVEHNGVDLVRFQPRLPSGYLHAELGVSRQKHLIGMIGQLGVRKGVDLFLAAAADILGCRADAHFLVIGRRYSRKQEAVEFEHQVRQQASRPPLRGHVHFLGLRHDVHRLLNELAILVHPARQEPLGRVLLEAAAAGMPIVATDAGGTCEIFPPSECTAVLVPPNSPDMLSAAICSLLDDQRRRIALGAAARARAMAAFDKRHVARRLAAHYHAVAERPS